ARRLPETGVAIGRWHPRCDVSMGWGRGARRPRTGDSHEMDSVRCGPRVGHVPRGGPVGTAAGCGTVNPSRLIADGAAGDTAIGSDAAIGAAAIGEPANDAVPEP